MSNMAMSKQSVQLMFLVHVVGVITAAALPTELSVNGLLQADFTSFPAADKFVLTWKLSQTFKQQNARTATSELEFEVQIASEWTAFPAATSSSYSRISLGDSISWSSGVVQSTTPLFQLPDALTQTFASGSTYKWRVRISDSSTWSEAAYFDTAPTTATFANSIWIGGGSEVQTQFVLPNTPVVRARAYASGLGSYKMWLNGNPVDDHIMDPGEAVYDQKVLYAAHNITSMFKIGNNTFTAQIGNSKWGYLDIYTNRTATGDQSGDSTRAFMVLITITFLDGKEMSVSSGSSWKARHGPIVYDHLWHGEIIDFRNMEAPWYPAVVMKPKAGRLYPQLMPPIRVTKSFSPISSIAINQTQQFDFGQNMAGVATLELPKTETGTHTLSNTANPTVIIIRLKHTEITDSGNQAYNNYFPGMEFNHASATCSMSDWYERKWYECANQTDGIIFEWPLTAPLSYTPTFTYHGFRFISLTAVQLLPDGSEVSLSKALRADFPFGATVTAHRAHSDVRPIATMNFKQQEGDASATAMATLIEKTFNATIASHISNLWSIPTDCPQREKRGWMGDAGISSSSLNTFYDAFAFHVNFVRLIVDNQIKGCADQPHTSIYGPCENAQPGYFNGSVPDVTPFPTGPYGGNPGTTDWQVAFVVIARNLLLHYDRLAVPVLMEVWSYLDGFMDYLNRLSDQKTGLLLAGARGDWVPPTGSVKTSAEECAAFWHTLCVGFMAEIATAIGRSSDAARYTARLKSNRLAYHTLFYHPLLKVYGIGSQCSQVFALHAEVVPADLIKEVAGTLANKIQNSALAQANGATGPHLEVGIFGTTFVFDVLQANGYDALALQVLNQTTSPSLGYMIANDATTLWEGWDGDQHHIGKTGTSRNHIMFGGGVNRFLAAAVGGLAIETRPMAAIDSSGWRRVSVFPSSAAIRWMNRASFSRRTPNGDASVSWSKKITSVVQESPIKFELNVTIPLGCVADVRIPLLSLSAAVARVSSALDIVCEFVCEVQLSAIVTKTNGCGKYDCVKREHDNEYFVALTLAAGIHSFTHA